MQNCKLLQQRVSEKTLAKQQKSMSAYSSFKVAKAREIDQSCVFNSSLLQHGKEKVVGLVREKCSIKCMANKIPNVMLIDTGV